MARENLKAARRLAGLSQQTVSEHLNIHLRHYKKLESGESLGSIPIWDALEDLFGLPQRYLREMCPDTADNQ